MTEQQPPQPRNDPIGCTPAPPPLTQAGRTAARAAYRATFQRPATARTPMPSEPHLRLPPGLT